MLFLINILAVLDYVKIIQVVQEPRQTKETPNGAVQKSTLIAFENYDFPLSSGESFRREDIYGEDGR